MTANKPNSYSSQTQQKDDFEDVDFLFLILHHR